MSSVYTILEYGAIPGENEINTRAIQAAVDACAGFSGRVTSRAGSTDWLRRTTAIS